MLRLYQKRLLLLRSLPHKMSFESIEQSLLVPPEQQKKIYNSATSCRNRIVLKKEDNTFAPKVCCVCDRHIIHGNEKFLPLQYLYNKCVQKCLRMDNEDWTLLNVTESIKTKLLKQYTPTFFNHSENKATKKLLKSFFLTNTYIINVFRDVSEWITKIGLF